MSIYGTPKVVCDNDVTDRIGIRTLILSLMWQPSRGGLSQLELDLEVPETPEVAGGLLLIGRQTRQSNGVYKTSWTFEGINGDGKGVTFQGRGNSLDYSFESGFEQLDITTHPNFEQLLIDYAGVYDPVSDRVLWDRTLQSATGTSSGIPGAYNSTASDTNPMFGRQDFFSMEGTYRYRYASLSTPSFVGVGFIAAPPGGPPPLSDGRNWLKMPVIYRRRGLIFDVTEPYWLSRAGGWPDPVYRNRSGGGRGAAGIIAGAASGSGLSLGGTGGL